MVWKLALRIARREALRHKGRSLLVAAMLALPVAGAGAADTLYRTAQLSPAERATRAMGAGDALVTFVAPVPIEQLPSGSVPIPPQAQQLIDGALQGVRIPSPAAYLPPGTRLVPLPDSVSVRVQSPHGYFSLTATERPLADLLLAGLYHRESGRAPARPGEVTLSPSLLTSLGKQVGDTLRLQSFAARSGEAAPVRTLTITGEYDNPLHLNGDLLLVAPGTLPADPQATSPTSWIAQVPGGVSWQQVLRLNVRGYSAVSRQVLENPPPDSRVPFLADHAKAAAGTDKLTEVILAVGTVAVVLALLEVVLLAGPAFAVGARRRRRDFGLMGAAGANRRHIRTVVLADGVVLGLAGGVIGVGLGIAGAYLTLPELTHFTHHLPGAFRVAPGELALSATLGIVTGLIAALLPAVVTGRQDVLASLTGGRKGARGVPWRSAVLGVLTVTAGLAATVYGAYKPGIHTLALAGGIAVCELGVVGCTPLLITAAGRLGRRLPLPGRLALRDSARNRGRTAPAVAAILAAVAGSTAVAVLLTTEDAQGRAQYHSTLRPGQVALKFGNYLGVQGPGDGPVTDGEPGGAAPAPPVDTAKAMAAIGATLPLRSAAVIQGVDASGFLPVRITLRRDASQACPFSGSNALQFDGSLTGEQLVASDPRCAGDGFAQVVPGDVAALRALTGTVDPAAERVLAAGGAVVFDPHDLSGPASAPTAVVALDRACVGTVANMPARMAAAFTKYCGHPAPQPVALPAVLARASDGSLVAGVRALIPPSVAAAMGVPYQPQMILFDTTRMPTSAEEQRANAAAESLGIDDVLTVEHGYQGTSDTVMLALAGIAAFVTLAAAAIATGLAVTDGEADLQTLAAVGAPPRVRRILAGSQATVTAALGAVLGSATGLVPAVALVEARAHSFVESAADNGSPVHATSYLAIPWWFLIGTIVVVPALAGLGAVAVTRSKVELRRRG